MSKECSFITAAAGMSIGYRAILRELQEAADKDLAHHQPRRNCTGSTPEQGGVPELTSNIPSHIKPLQRKLQDCDHI